MHEPLQQLDNFSASYNNHVNSKQVSYEKRHVLLIDIRSADKQQLNTTLTKLGYIPVEINNTDNNKSRILDIKNEIISNSCPLIPQELTLRITHAINYFEAAQASSYALTLSRKGRQKAASPLIQKKAMTLAKNAAAYLQTKLGEDIQLSELIVKMGTNRNKLNDAFKTSYGLTVFAWLHEKRMSLAQELLETTTLGILQVGEQVGYPDSNNFSTAFKRTYELSPRHYRQSLS